MTRSIPATFAAADTPYTTGQRLTARHLTALGAFPVGAKAVDGWIRRIVTVGGEKRGYKVLIVHVPGSGMAGETTSVKIGA